MIAYESLPDGWVARGEITVGTDRRVLEITLGTLSAPPDPGGLRSAPVVVVPAELVRLVEAGARRAGGDPSTVRLPLDGDRPIGGRLLTTAMEGAEYLVVVEGDDTAIVAARALAGRPLLVLPLGTPEAAAALLAGLDLDVNLAIPSLETRRDEIRSAVAPLGLERLHHPVEVDPRPAFDELGRDPEETTLGELAAAATGVLAGRMSAANRRWRP